MKAKLLLLPIIAVSLTSCQKEIKGNSFYFDTYVEVRLFEGEKEDVSVINRIFSKIDKLTDNFEARDLDNIYNINNTEENVVVEPELYEVLKWTFSDELSSLKMFNPLCGSLSKKWKEALKNKTLLDESTITTELANMSGTHIKFVNENTVKRVGKAEIDLGAVAKGYALDKAKEYLDAKEYKNYLIDAGSSSILLGEKSGGKDFNILISNLQNTYIEAKNCFVSTSSHSRQKVEIDGKIYSHIINPITGSAINEHDAVIVISKSGYLGDILSTDFVNESTDSIKSLEGVFDVQAIVIDDGAISYQNEGIKVVKK